MRLVGAATKSMAHTNKKHGIGSLISPVYFGMLKHLSLKHRLQVEFLRKHNRFPNLDLPETYSEKIAWRKLADRDQRLPIWSDKVKVKELVASKIGSKYTLPNLWMGRNPGDIPLNELAKPYVIKTSNGSGGVTFIREGQPIFAEKTRKEVKAHLDNPFATHTDEWPYGKISPRIIVEPMLLEHHGALPVDYKFHVFSGKTQFIQVDVGRFHNHRRDFYDPTWKKQSFELKYPMLDRSLPRPEVLGEMIAVAELLGAHFHYVRIDLYNVMNKVIFGEATFFPGAGYLHFKPQKIDYQWGSLWDLPKTNEIC